MFRCESNVSRLVNYENSDSDTDTVDSYDDDTDSDNSDDSPQCSANPRKFMRWKQLVRTLSSVILSQEHDRMELIDVDLAIGQLHRSCTKLQSQSVNFKQIKSKLQERLDLLLKHENISLSQKKILHECEQQLKSAIEPSGSEQNIGDSVGTAGGNKMGNLKKSLYVLPVNNASINVQK